VVLVVESVEGEGVLELELVWAFGSVAGKVSVCVS
jgi:hypothetical protein